MTSSARQTTLETQESSLPEVTNPLDAEVSEEAAVENEPLIFSVMARLTEVLSEETRLVREGNFAAFTELQREKGLLLRQAERLEHARNAMGSPEHLNTELVKRRLDGFNEVVETNMRSIGAVKDAISHVRTKAIEKLEDEKGDGVYSRGGGKRSLQHLSMSDSKVKL